MNQLIAIAKNSYLQSVRQPVYGLVVIITLAGLGFSPAVTGWTLDDDNKMLRDIGLSTLLIQGLFLACFAASGVLDVEIEDKTVLTVTAKPVSRPTFILGKYIGVLGALFTAHYLALIGYLMAMRHGVLQSAAESSDITVLVFGPGAMILVLIAAGLLNFALEWRFLPSVVGLAVPTLTLGGAILLVVNRDFKFAAYETVQEIGPLPAGVTSENLKGIVTFRPKEGNVGFAGNEGSLVRSNWKGPISDADRAYLLKLVDDVQWRKNINYIVKDSRDADEFEILKASILTFGAIAILGAVALAAATRLSVVPTFILNLVVIGAGLGSDQFFRPRAEDGKLWAEFLYSILPNFQCFWMVDAMEESRLIPVTYIASSLGYAALLVIALLLVAMALFETREVG